MTVYAALWRILPGPVWVRVVLLLILLALVLTACVFVVFPWLNTFINTAEVTVDQ